MMWLAYVTPITFVLNSGVLNTTERYDEGFSISVEGLPANSTLCFYIHWLVC